MAYDIKAATPDTSINDSALLIGADSQSATNPSIYAVSVVRAHFMNSPTLVTPALGTPSSGMLTSCTGLPIVGGTTGTLGETRGGTGQTTYATGDLLYASGANTRAKLAAGTNTHVLTLTAGVPTWAAATGGASAPLTLASGTITTSQPFLTGTQTWNDGAVAFTALLVNVTNTASAAASLLMDLQVASSTVFNITKSGNINISGDAGATFVHTYDSGGNYFLIRSANGVVVSINGSVSNGPGLALNRDLAYGWASTNSGNLLNQDLTLWRDAANILAQRNSTSAQTFRLYFSYTDASNYTRLTLKTATGIQTLETESAGTGEANIDLALTPKGTGRVRYGTHSAIGAETVTGFIEIKDSGGTTRKIAVVS